MNNNSLEKLMKLVCKMCKHNGNKEPCDSCSDCAEMKNQINEILEKEQEPLQAVYEELALLKHHYEKGIIGAWSYNIVEKLLHLINDGENKFYYRKETTI